MGDRVFLVHHNAKATIPVEITDPLPHLEDFEMMCNSPVSCYVIVNGVLWKVEWCVQY